MEVMFVLIGASLLVAIGFLVAFLWAVRSGQYEDTYTPSLRMLFNHGLSGSNTTANQGNRPGNNESNDPS